MSLNFFFIDCTLMTCQHSTKGKKSTENLNRMSIDWDTRRNWKCLENCVAQINFLFSMYDQTDDDRVLGEIANSFSKWKNLSEFLYSIKQRRIKSICCLLFRIDLRNIKFLTRIKVLWQRARDEKNIYILHVESSRSRSFCWFNLNRNEVYDEKIQ